MSSNGRLDTPGEDVASLGIILLGGETDGRASGRGGLTVGGSKGSGGVVMGG